MRFVLPPSFLRVAGRSDVHRCRVESAMESSLTFGRRSAVVRYCKCRRFHPALLSRDLDRTRHPRLDDERCSSCGLANLVAPCQCCRPDLGDATHADSQPGWHHICGDALKTLIGSRTLHPSALVVHEHCHRQRPPGTDQCQQSCYRDARSGIALTCLRQARQGFPWGDWTALSRDWTQSSAKRCADRSDTTPSL